MQPKDATEIDRAVGARIASLRKAKGLSQTALGIPLSISFQQVQKYEKGLNRVSAGRLQVIAKLLDVPVATLFGDDLEMGAQTDALDFLNLPGAAELLEAFGEIESLQLRRDVLALARTAARMKAQPGTEDA